MRKAPAALAFTTLVLLTGACSDSVSPPVSPELETVMAADLGGSGLSKEDRASLKAVVKYLADNGESNGAVFFPSGSTGLFYIAIGTDAGGFPTLDFCAFIGDGVADWDRENPDGSITIHKAVKGAEVIYAPGAAGSPEYGGTGNFTMRATGFGQSIPGPSGGTIRMVIPSGGAQVMWGTGWVQEVAGSADPFNTTSTGTKHQVQCGEVIDASGATRRAGIFFR
jgi:hypothetical protein